MIASPEETKSVILSSLLFVDEKIQEALYEKLGSGELSRDGFQKLMTKLSQWQDLSKELLSMI